MAAVLRLTHAASRMGLRRAAALSLARARLAPVAAFSSSAPPRSPPRADPKTADKALALLNASGIPASQPQLDAALAITAAQVADAQQPDTAAHSSSNSARGGSSSSSSSAALAI